MKSENRCVCRPRLAPELSTEAATIRAFRYGALALDDRSWLVGDEFTVLAHSDPLGDCQRETGAPPQNLGCGPAGEKRYLG